jgi:filamentous hemagglutinin
MMAVNRSHNGGTLRDDTTGEAMVPAKKSVKGVTPPSNEVQVDHKIPESKGGTRDSGNLQLMTRANNRKKWDKMPNDASSQGVPPGTK